VEAWSDAPVGREPVDPPHGPADGARVLRTWMGVIREERDGLDRVLRRYAATADADVLLAEAESGLVAVGGTGWSSVSATAELERRPHLVDAASAPGTGRRGRGRPADGRARFELVPERSAVLIEARSTVGPISFGALGITGWVEADVAGGDVAAGQTPAAWAQIPVTGLRSGNRLYDAELLRRIDAPRFPYVVLDLDDCTPVGVGGRFRLRGAATLHGVTRPLEGTVVAHLTDDGALVVSGEQAVDIRDFAIDSPTVLMLRIYPDVTVRLQLEARWDGGSEEVAP